jgi:ABC-type microcin C transport system duplicated ATPase subunit YejF
MVFCAAANDPHLNVTPVYVRMKNKIKHKYNTIKKHIKYKILIIIKKLAVDNMDLRFKHSFSLIVAGPSGSGISILIQELLRS